MILMNLRKLKCTQRVRHCSTEERLTRRGVCLNDFDGSFGDFARVVANSQGRVGMRKAEEPSEKLE